MDDDIAEALMESQYLAGLKAGWNCGVDNAVERYEDIVKSQRDMSDDLSVVR
ncbi:MAG TPA: hypothetical protein VMQ76_01275 [Terracidiphilus sp.]|nr:hypothetical protein [Terracidiphilus sp.]